MTGSNCYHHHLMRHSFEYTEYSNNYNYNNISSIRSLNASLIRQASSCFSRDAQFSLRLDRDRPLRNNYYQSILLDAYKFFQVFESNINTTTTQVYCVLCISAFLMFKLIVWSINCVAYLIDCIPALVDNGH